MLFRPLPRSMTPEFQTLLACARTRLGPAETDFISAAVHREVDFARFLSLAMEHGVTPLVYRNLRAVCWGDLPAGFQSELAGHMAANAGRSRFLTAELIRLLQAFESAGIRAVPFKGPALAASAYGDIGLREFTDLDLLVRQRDLTPIARILRERGYATRETGAHTRSAAFLRNECEYHYFGPGGSTTIEIHWRPAQRLFDFPFALETRWDRLVEAELEGFRILAFPPEDQLLFLCVHAAKHLWSDLKWICDVAELIRAFPDLDWRLALRQAALVRNERTLLLGLALAQLLLGAELPAWVRTRIERCSSFASVIADIIERLDTLAEPGALQIALFHMARKAGVYQKLRQCWLILTCPMAGDWDAGPAPIALVALRRPLRLLWKYW